MQSPSFTHSGHSFATTEIFQNRNALIMCSSYFVRGIPTGDGDFRMSKTAFHKTVSFCTGFLFAFSGGGTDVARAGPGGASTRANEDGPGANGTELTTS